MVLNSIFNPIFSPLVKISPLVAVLAVSIFFSLLVILITKFATNQERLKQIKEEISSLRKEISISKNDPQKMMELNSKMMKLSTESMKHNFKTSFWTIIPAILILGWFSSNLSYLPIKPDAEFILTAAFQENAEGMAKLNVKEGLEIIGDNEKEAKDNKIEWKLKGKPGDYLIELEFNNKFFTKDVLITGEQAYKTPKKAFKNDVVESISVSNEKLIILNLFGWKLGWLGSYIIFALIFMPMIRKVMKVY